MKKVFSLTQTLLVVLLGLAFGACSSELSELEPNGGQGSKHTIKMNFVGGVVGFDQSNQAKAQIATRATSSSWNEGDKIYITFYNGTDIIPGEATYSATSGWSVSYDGNLATGTSLKCEARYFVNATFSCSSLVSLNANSEIYEDLNATYAYSNGSLTVTATLSPKTGRLRFTGKEKDSIYTTGITVYTTFSPAINQFSTSNAMIKSKVGANGSTPYIYGYFTDSDRNLGLVGSDFSFTRTCTADMFNTGESGYMAIPSETSHNNWRSGLYVKANGVEFKMIPVAGYSGGFFLMAETETTEALYNSVNGTVSTSQFPIDAISYSDIKTFIEKINNNTQLNFSLPSTEQWQYAAMGGNKSQSYIYAGSNIPGDVAWYSSNCSSKQKVKTKTPNELGIYDLSGNVEEFVTNRYSYSSYSFPCFCGGSYLSTSNSITNTSKSNMYDKHGYTSNADYIKDNGIGFRLILTCK